MLYEVITSAPAEKITYRSGARENDLICVSGDLGGAFMGLQLLEREKKIFQTAGAGQPDLSDFSYVLERQLKPEARRDIVNLLAAKGIQPVITSYSIHYTKLYDPPVVFLYRTPRQYRWAHKFYVRRIPDNQHPEPAHQ